MSYRIEYGSTTPMKFLQKRRKTDIRTLTALCMILFALAVGQFWPRGKAVLRGFLLPGKPSMTEQAFSCLVSDLSQGVGFEEAMTTFCQQIIDNGAGEPG